MEKIKINNFEIGGEKIFVIAETASSHNGKVSIMKQLINIAVKSGADAIKFQKFYADELIVPEDPRYNNFRKIELKEKDWDEIFKFARQFNIIKIADVFDEKSADFMDKMGVSAFKLHSTDITNPNLIVHVAKKKKPVILATGGSTFKEIDVAVKLIKKSGNNKILLMHGFQNFPTKIEDTNLRLIKALKERYKVPVGFHDHVDAETGMAVSLPLVSLGFGARMIEKHITDKRSKKRFDWFSALELKEMKKLVEQIREAEKSFGNGKNKFSRDEETYRKKFKKYIVARKDIRKGESITNEKLAFKRNMLKKGLMPSEAGKVVGKQASKNYKKNEVVK